MQIEYEIQNNWKLEKLLQINCLLEVSGRIVLFKYFEREIDNSCERFLVPFCETSLTSIKKYNDDLYWVNVQSFTKIIQDKEGNRYCGGEGSMGNEGFITCTDNSGNFKWAIFSQDSNPFYHLSIEGEYLKAYSSYDLEFAININNPEIITISKAEWKDEWNKK